jgi:hypothetical protein
MSQQLRFKHRPREDVINSIVMVSKTVKRSCVPQKPLSDFWTPAHTASTITFAVADLVTMAVVATEGIKGLNSVFILL